MRNPFKLPEGKNVGKIHEKIKAKEEVAELYPNRLKDDFLKDFADKHVSKGSKVASFDKMEDIDNWETTPQITDKESSEDVWNMDSISEDEYSNFGELDYLSELDRSAKTEKQAEKLRAHNERIHEINSRRDLIEADTSTEEGLIDSIDASYQKDQEAFLEEFIDKKAKDKKNAKEAKFAFKDLKRNAPEFSKAELAVMKTAYENYYQNFLLKSAQKEGNAEEFNRLSKLEGKLEVSGKVFQGQALKEDAVDYAKLIKREKLDQADWQVMPYKIMNQIQFDPKNKCLKTFEDTTIKTKNDKDQVVLQPTRIIYTFGRNDKLSDTYKIIKKTGESNQGIRQVKVYEIEFQPPFFEKPSAEKKEGEKAVLIKKKVS